MAEKVGVSKQTFQDWIKGRRKIPQQRLEHYPDCSELRKSNGFRRIYLILKRLRFKFIISSNQMSSRKSKFPILDDNGEEYTVKQHISQNKRIIDFLHERSEEDRLLERVFDAVRNDQADGKENKVILEQFLMVLEGKASKRRTVELVLYALTEYGQDEWGGVHPQFIDEWTVV